MSLFLPEAPTIAAFPRNHTYLPTIKAHTLPVKPQGEPLSVEKQVYTMMALHPLQGRKGMVWNQLLADVAKARCQSQAIEGWTGHVDPDGYGANWWVERYGYDLPEWYGGGRANNIESLAHNGKGIPAEVFNGWLKSDGHRQHILGTNPFYAEQVQVGIGYYFLETSEKRHYWAVITAPTEGI